MTGDLKEQVRAKLNISEVVGEYVQLRKTGKSLIGLCPFHQEKTPSFHVDPAKNLYHCFGCRAGGDVFDFVMKMEGLAFPEALAFLAQKAGVAVPEASLAESPEARLRRELFEANELACSFFQRALQGPSGKGARDYLRSRGVESREIRRFQLGYAPDRWDALTNFLVDSGKAEAGENAGLLVARSTGGAYDRFRGRIMFPFADTRGRVVAFGARGLEGEQPKYLNSPETAVYVKRQQLYGFAQAKEAMRRERRVVVVEGYFDCIALQQNGIGYAVASCGTALTEQHAQLLKRFASDLFLCFDADEAGRRAVARASTVLQDCGFTVWVVRVPDGHDPDSFIAKEGRAAFLAEMERALPLTEYLLEEALSLADMRSVAGRMRGVRAAVPILRRLDSPVERDAYVQRVASRLGVSPRSLASEVLGARDSGGGTRRHTNPAYRDTNRDSTGSAAVVVPDGRSLLEREMVRCLIHDTSGVAAVVEELGPSPFQIGCYNELLQALAGGGSGTALVEQLGAKIGPDIASVLAQPPESGLLWQDYLEKMRLEQLREELRAIEERLAGLVEHNPVKYMTQMSEGLLAFREWRGTLQSYCRTQSEAS